jgi:hypothetical protein
MIRAPNVENKRQFVVLGETIEIDGCAKVSDIMDVMKKSTRKAETEMDKA